MTQNNWSNAVELVQHFVVRISTPRGSGSGFLIHNAKNSSLCSIATAAHVVDNAHYWEEPIRIDHVASGKSLVIRRDERAVLLEPGRDTAAVVFNRGELPLPTSPLPLAPKDMFLKVGNEIGWFGFPAMTSNLCFFVGTISTWIQDQNAYLVDGVAINGVSGGPAFHVQEVDGKPIVVVMGVVSAYIPNRATGEVLPGLSVVRDVSQFHDLAPKFASLDQAQSAEQSPEIPQVHASKADATETTTRYRS